MQGLMRRINYYCLIIINYYLLLVNDYYIFFTIARAIGDEAVSVRYNSYLVLTPPSIFPDDATMLLDNKTKRKTRR